MAIPIVRTDYEMISIFNSLKNTFSDNELSLSEVEEGFSHLTNKNYNIFFPKLDFHNDQIYFKDIALEFLEENVFEPVLVNSEKSAKEFEFLSAIKTPDLSLITWDISGKIITGRSLAKDSSNTCG